MILDNPDIITANKFVREKIQNCLLRKKIIVVIGNGGFAAESSHLVGELIPNGIPAITLNDPAVITAIANDKEYSLIYTTQLLALRHQVGLLIAMSTSGKSENIINPVRALRDTDIDILEIIGHPGARFGDLMFADMYHMATANPVFKNCDAIVFHGNTGEIQEQTLKLIHAIYNDAKLESGVYSRFV